MPRIDRGELFAGLFILAFANGAVERVEKSVARDGIVGAIVGTFDISIIVWMACWTTLSLLSRSAKERASGTDLMVGLGVIATALVPFPLLSWVGLTGLALYVLHRSAAGSPRRRAGVVLLALTVPMFWSRLLFAMCSEPILRADATLASLITGTDRVGNTVRFADNWGYLFIGPPCSSLANVSLAVLCWVLFNQLFVGGRALTQALCGLLACLAVIAINVSRIGLIGLDHQYFDLLHGWVGATVASWLTLAAIVGINLYGHRHAAIAGR